MTGHSSSTDDDRNQRAFCSGLHSCARSGDNVLGQGISAYFITRGCIISANIFLTTSFVFLASSDAGCIDKDDQITENCQGRTFGMAPASLIAAIPTFSGVLCTLLMPFFGAIIDYTQYRRSAGIVAAALLTFIQLVQVGTGRRTWFLMAVLQGIAGALFEFSGLAIFSYMPQIAREAGIAKMPTFQSWFLSFQYISQFSFLLSFVALSFILGWNNGWGSVLLGRVSQAVLTLVITASLVRTWSLLPHVPPQHRLRGQEGLWLAGFRQVSRTVRKIFHDFNKSLFLFMLAVTIGEAFAFSLTTLSPIYLASFLGFSGTQVGIFFVAAQLGLLVGPQVGVITVKWLNQKRGWCLSMFCMSLLALAGAALLRRGSLTYTYAWGWFMGVFVAWHYCMVRAIFSSCLPQGQDAEMAGFFQYCNNILSWLPPLMYSTIVQNDVDQNYALGAVSIFGFIAVAILLYMPAWEDVLADVRKFDEVNPAITTTTPARSPAVTRREEQPKELNTIKPNHTSDEVVA